MLQSHAILRYFNQKGNASLFSADPHTNARIEEALEFIRSAIIPPSTSAPSSILARETTYSIVAVR